MFHNLLSVCPQKELYKANIYSCYKEYIQCYYNVKNKDANVKSLMTTKEWDNLSPETKESYCVNGEKQKEIVEEMVSLVKVYCKKYPNEDVCNHFAFKSYDKYPYRLPQTIQDFIKLL